MTLGNKTITLFVILGLGFSVGSLFALRTTVTPVFEQFERDSSKSAVARVTQTLDAEIRELATLTMDYAHWDDSYAYAQGKDPAYARKNLNKDYWRSQDIDLLLVANATGTTLFSLLIDHADGNELVLQEQTFQPLDVSHPLMSSARPKMPVSGLLKLSSGLMYVVSYPILTDSDEGPIAGYFVTGRYLNTRRLDDFGERTSTSVSIRPLSDVSGLSISSSGIAKLTTSGQALHIEVSEENTFAYKELDDIFGEPVALIEVRTPRDISRIGSNTVRTAMMASTGAGIVFLLAAWIFMQRTIVSPIARLREKILTIRSTGELDVEFDHGSSDEVGMLSREFAELLSKLKSSQYELEQARDNAILMSEAKSEFLARMSHEIRTPMNGVLGMTELLQDTVLNNTQQRFANTIYESAESLLSIINDILDFSKIEAGKLSLEVLDIDLQNILEETMDSLASQAHKKRLELVLMAPHQLNCSVRGDPGRLRQVLTNLVGNAIKFTENGEVLLRVTAEEVAGADLNVAFEIQDTGIGIRPEKQKVIFDSFTQEDGTTTRFYGGTGLGLSISKQLVDLMGGNLVVESTPGKGSTFSFSLRLGKGCELDAAMAKQGGVVGGTHILVVDDNETNREILERQLSGWRAQVKCTDSAKTAICALETEARSGHPYDLAILDMHMPEIDGLQLARMIRANPKLANLKLIILSSVAAPASEDMMRELDIAGQLAKPIRQSQLYDSLVVVLGGQNVAETHSKLRVASAKALAGHILLAEDNPVNQAVAVGMLESLGLAVTVVSNGSEAVESVSHGHFDVILMDCQMPVMDGFAATKVIRKSELEAGESHVPIVAVTANALKGDRELCLQAGMDEYLSKPFTGEQLHSLLSSILRPAVADQPDIADMTANAGDVSNTTEAVDSPLDENVLAMLDQLQQPGAPSFFRKVADAYLQSSEELGVKLRDAVKNADATILRECAHALKSSSANVGALVLADICKLLEMQGRTEDLGETPALINRFEREYQRVVAALQLKLGSISP